MLTLEEYETRPLELNMREGEISMVRRIAHNLSLRLTGKDQMLAEAIQQTDGGIRSGFPRSLLEDIQWACAIARAEGEQEANLRWRLEKRNDSD